jgi:four helix bundle protein
MTTNNSKIKSYKDLEVWKKGVLLSIEVYKITSGFPASELYALTNQMRRASASIPANIAEGYGRESTKNYVQFLKTSRGSLYELDTFLTIAIGLKFLSKEAKENLSLRIEAISKMINSLIRTLSKSLS